MSHPPLPFNVEHFLADEKMTAMATHEIGAYLLLLFRAWVEEPVGTIPDNNRTLSRWSKLSLSEWLAIKETVLGSWELIEDRYHQKRLKWEWAKLEDLKQKRLNAGITASQVRWSTEGHITLPPNAVRGWSEMLKFFKFRCIACGTADRVGPALIDPKGKLIVENLQPLCMDCIELGAYKNKDLRVDKMVGDPKEMWQTDQTAVTEKTLFAMYAGWEPGKSRLEWIALNFPKLGPFRLREIIDNDLVAYWTEPGRVDALKTHRGWEIALGNRLKFLRNKGWLYRKDTNSENKRGLDAIQAKLNQEINAPQRP